MSSHRRIVRQLPTPLVNLPNVKLVKAIETHKIRKVEQALDDEADPNYITSEGYPVLFLAFSHDEEILELLLDQPNININVVDGIGMSLLHHVALYGMNDIIEILINKGVNLDLNDQNERTAIWYAIKNRHLDTVGCLLDAGASIHINSIKLFIREFNLINENVRNSSDGSSLEVYDGIIVMFEKLLTRYQLNTPTPNYIPIIKRIVKTGNVEIFNYLNYHYPDLVREIALVELNRNETLLHYVTNIDIARQLLKYGADVNAINNYGDPPIIYLDDDQLELAQLFLECGADLNIKVNGGQTIEEYFTTTNEVGMVKLINDFNQNKLDLKEPDVE